MCAFFQLWSSENYTSKFRPHLRHKISCSFSLHSSSRTFKLLSMTSYGGELVLDSSSPWSDIFKHLSSFSILLSLIFKKQRTSLMKKIQGLQAPHGVTSCAYKIQFHGFLGEALKSNVSSSKTFKRLYRASLLLHTSLRRLLFYCLPLIIFGLRRCHP